jgi:hypothetical protein
MAVEAVVLEVIDALFMVKQLVVVIVQSQG